MRVRLSMVLSAAVAALALPVQAQDSKPAAKPAQAPATRAAADAKAAKPVPAATKAVVPAAQQSVPSDMKMEKSGCHDKAIDA